MDYVQRTYTLIKRQRPVRAASLHNLVLTTGWPPSTSLWHRRTTDLSNRTPPSARPS